MANTMFEEFRQAQAEIKRLLLERDLARDQAASAAGDLERYARLTEQAVQAAHEDRRHNQVSNGGSLRWTTCAHAVCLRFRAALAEGE